MSSLEIAEVTGKDHANVLKDIRRILEEAGIDAVRFNGTYRDVQNKERPCYHLPRLECDLVMSGYSVPYRLAIIQRWHELEAKAPATKPVTLRESLVLNLELLDKNEVQARQLQIKTRELAAKDEQLEEQRPKVKAFDNLMDSDGLYGMAAAAKAPGRTLTSFTMWHESHCVLRVFAPVSPHSHKPPLPLTRERRSCFWPGRSQPQRPVSSGASPPAGPGQGCETGRPSDHPSFTGGSTPPTHLPVAHQKKQRHHSGNHRK